MSLSLLTIVPRSIPKCRAARSDQSAAHAQNNTCSIIAARRAFLKHFRKLSSSFFQFSASRIRIVPSRLGRPADRQAHDGVVVALHAGRARGLRGPEWRRHRPCRRVPWWPCRRRSPPPPCGKKVTLQLSTKLSVRSAVRHADTGVHLVGRTGQGAEHPLCVLHAVGLAEDFAAHIHDGVTAQHHRAGMVFCHGEAFAPGQLFHQLGRGGAP